MPRLGFVIENLQLWEYHPGRKLAIAELIVGRPLRTNPPSSLHCLSPTSTDQAAKKNVGI